MKLKALFAAALALTVAPPVTAAPIELDLSLGALTATFFGLDDAGVGVQQATAFTVTGLLDTYSNVDASLSSTNEFSFVGGSLQSVDFFFVGSIPGDTLASTTLDGLDCDGDLSGLTCSFFEVTPVTTVPSEGPVTVSTRAVAPVPLPAGGVLLVTGLAGVAVLKLRRKAPAEPDTR